MSQDECAFNVELASSLMVSYLHSSSVQTLMSLMLDAATLREDVHAHEMAHYEQIWHFLRRAVPPSLPF